MNETESELHVKLNAETGKISWRELERHYARGVVIAVSPDLDLVDVAVHMAQDDVARVSGWLGSGLVARASEEDARQWQETEAEFWAVVAAPWVLVQPVAKVH